MSLRHLIVSPWDVPEVPSGIGYLTNLETLSVFAISRESGPSAITGLKNLNNLQGELHITGLHHIPHGDMFYYLEPDLASKKKLTHLFLHWSTFLNSKAENNDETLLHVLRPHTNIQHIVVEGYRGAQFPSWFENEGFTRLSFLKIDNCINCTKLPAVGQLPMLQHLKLERLKGLQIVGPEFFGNNHISFPCLETLSFYDMPELEIWCYRDEGESPFPCLREMHVSLCPKIKSFQISNLPALQRCNFNWCHKLTAIDGLSTEWIVSKLWCGIIDTRIGHLQDKNRLYKFELLNKDNPNLIVKKMTIIACPLLQGLDKKDPKPASTKDYQNLIKSEGPGEIASISKDSKSTSTEDHQNLIQSEGAGEIASTSVGFEVSDAMQLTSKETNTIIPVNSLSKEFGLTRKEVLHNKNNRLKRSVISGIHIALAEKTTSEEEFQFGEEMQQGSQHEGTSLMKERRETLDMETDFSTSTFLHMWANSMRNTFLSGFSFIKSLPAIKNPPVKEVRRTSL